jgi:hypothetical protein
MIEDECQVMTIAHMTIGSDMLKRQLYLCIVFFIKLQIKLQIKLNVCRFI